MSTAAQSTEGVTRIRAQKKELRDTMLFVRDALPEDFRKAASAAVCEAFLSSVPYHFASNILLYAPHGSETDVFSLFEKAVCDGKAVYFPKCEGRGVMRFFRVRSREDLTAGKFGILSPRTDAEEYLPEGGKPSDVCVVPGVCFDLDGYRIGSGGGYYDRFLARFAGVRVSLTFDALLIKDACVPREKRYDKRVDVLYTEREVKVVGI